MNEHSHARFALLAIYKQTTKWLLHTLLSNTTQASTKLGFNLKKRVRILAAHRIVPPNEQIATNNLSLAKAQHMKSNVIMPRWEKYNMEHLLLSRILQSFLADFRLMDIRNYTYAR